MIPSKPNYLFSKELNIVQLRQARVKVSVWGSGGIAPDSDSCPGDFTPGTHWIGGRVGPRASMEAIDKRKISCPFWNSNPDSPVVQAVA
jgi:hypothetical protein